VQAEIILVTFYWQRQYFICISPTDFRLIAVHICEAQTIKLHMRNITLHYTGWTKKTGPFREVYIISCTRWRRKAIYIHKIFSTLSGLRFVFLNLSQLNILCIRQAKPMLHTKQRFNINVSQYFFSLSSELCSKHYAMSKSWRHWPHEARSDTLQGAISQDAIKRGAWPTAYKSGNSYIFVINVVNFMVYSALMWFFWTCAKHV